MVEFFNSSNKVVLVVEYDGRHYHGFQWQTNLPTIQAELEESIRKLTGENGRVSAASRTDAGVHAKGQVVGFWTKSNLSAQTFIRALNYYLPEDISVKAACRVNRDFDVRRDALSREYEYRVWNSYNRSPFVKDFAYLVKNELNIKIMNRACKSLEGEHDFASFATFLGELKSTMRHVYKAKVIRQESLVIFHMVANSFLPHQVRNTVGLLIRVGLGKVTLEQFRQIMEARTLGLAGPTAPAYGLCLTKVHYPSALGLGI